MEKDGEPSAELSQPCTEQTVQVEEDDWSSFMCSGGTAFGRHEVIILRISDGCRSTMSSTGSACNKSDEEGRRGHQISIHCVSALSPLDMIDMYHGSQDATGNRVWTGALLFLEAFARNIPTERNRSTDTCVAIGELPLSANRTCIATTIQTKLCELRSQAFNNKAVIELGCGTGISGISLLAVDKDSPSSVTFTDFDGPALDLCKRNCGCNIDDKSKYSIQQLEWGSQLKEGAHPGSYDTVIATDVLYDISSLEPLMRTASELLRIGGYFILSHIPRASVDGEEETGSVAVARAEVLESLIVAEGSKHGLYLDSCFRPSELSLIWNGISLNETSFSDMDEIGAAVLSFCKQCRHGAVK